MAIALSLIVHVTVYASSYGGAFESNLSPTFIAPLCPICGWANSATGACACPAGAEFIQYISVINDCHPSIFRPAAIGMCSPGSIGPNASFGGAYQTRDVSKLRVGGPPPRNNGARDQGPVCYSPNRFTDNCSCPASMIGLSFRALAPLNFPSDGASEFEGSVVTICTRLQAPTDGALLGAYQTDDLSVTIGDSCRVPNPLTGACSCPAGAAAQPLRVIVDSPAIMGSYIVLCYQGPSPIQSPVQVCAGVEADAGGVQDASAALQLCLDRTAPGGELALPPGTYALEHGLAISHALRLTTRGTGSTDAGCGRAGSQPCAVLRGTSALQSPFGLLFAHDTQHVVIDHIILDGNRGLRMQTAAYNSCGLSDRSPAYNSAMHACDNCSFIGSVSMNAICGTGGSLGICLDVCMRRCGTNLHDMRLTRHEFIVNMSDLVSCSVSSLIMSLC